MVYQSFGYQLDEDKVNNLCLELVSGSCKVRRHLCRKMSRCHVLKRSGSRWKSHDMVINLGGNVTLSYV